MANKYTTTEITETVEHEKGNDNGAIRAAVLNAYRAAMDTTRGTANVTWCGRQFLMVTANGTVFRKDEPLRTNARDWRDDTDASDWKR